MKHMTSDRTLQASRGTHAAAVEASADTCAQTPGYRFKIDADYSIDNTEQPSGL